MAATMHDVSRLAGVSVKTVSNVINDYPYVREETRRKVLDAIDTLGYSPNLSARSLRSGRTNVISLMIPDLRNAYFAELADSVMRAAAERGLAVLIEQFGDDRQHEIDVLRQPRARMVDGVLHSVLTLDQGDADLIAELSTPLVLLGDRSVNGTRDHVTMRNTEGARAATEHLIAGGRRRIVALGAHPGEEIGSAALRLDGYRQALDAAGIPFDGSLVVPVGTWLRRNGAEGMRDFLTAGTPFDGVVAFNDAIALGALRALQEAGLRVPEDVAVVGFDNVDETQYSMPTLSTIDPGREEIARTAVDLLIRRMEGSSEAFAPEEIAVPFRLVQRESSAG
ncbi:LacI family DNA-binding transcriptional regulator [Leifsonia shinshuensis]|uniref:LacI family DNA-binding transcriptional regulator n=1 Tax=Leifsonia shinshuensis TaxID=150026 RepID=UPI00285A7CF9|nr:LacI family DNA-binding transcriptional regulator [Leifsonia shinshuensis]MDR6972256.1 DNA-binding LacI/PurR family transcriptional regulator [Leifsonia shinshuensis]